MNAREKFAQVMAEIKGLKGNTADPESAKRMGELILDAQSLRSTIESENDAQALEEWASTSAGRVSLANGSRSGAQVVDFTPAGATEISQGDNKSAQVLLAEEYGDGI